MKKGNPELTDEQKARLYDLALLPDDQIDTGDISETDFSRSRKARGFFHSTNKREISLVLDDYVVDWFEENSTDGQDCHDYINMVLLEHIRQRRVRERREAPSPPNLAAFVVGIRNGTYVSESAGPNSRR